MRSAASLIADFFPLFHKFLQNEAEALVIAPSALNRLNILVPNATKRASASPAPKTSKSDITENPETYLYPSETDLAKSTKKR